LTGGVAPEHGGSGGGGARGGGWVGGFLVGGGGPRLPRTRRSTTVTASVPARCGRGGAGAAAGIGAGVHTTGSSRRRLATAMRSIDSACATSAAVSTVAAACAAVMAAPCTPPVAVPGPPGCAMSAPSTTCMSSWAGASRASAPSGPRVRPARAVAIQPMRIVSTTVIDASGRPAPASACAETASAAELKARSPPRTTRNALRSAPDVLTRQDYGKGPVARDGAPWGEHHLRPSPVQTVRKPYYACSEAMESAESGPIRGDNGCRSSGHGER
jgi:hypothetical protein